MKQLFYLSILGVCLLFWGCEEPNKSTTTVPTTTTIDSVTTPPQSHSDLRAETGDPMFKSDFTRLDALLSIGKKLNLDDFNKSIIEADDAKEGWVNSPFLIALQYTSDQLESESKKIEVAAPGPETKDQVIVTITENGLLDDAIKGSITILKLLKENNLWQVEKAGQLWECSPNRDGSTKGFSTEPCR